MRHETTLRIRAFRQALELAAAEQREGYRVLPRWSELKDFPGGSCELASNFLARYLMDSDKGLHPCIICMCGNDPFREAENSTVNGHVIVMLDGNYIDLTLDQFEEYAAYIPAEPIESGGIIGSLIHKIQKHEGEISTRPVKIGDGYGLFSLLSQSADELLASDPEMQALKRDAEASSKAFSQLFKR
ncbi:MULTISPECIES: hypothetical protein [Pantoea]|uniref:hypothetical protein n=1 Tax=Pantoea TaxID=53335 RepID=UPI000CF39275|nr:MULTISPECIES: hypothetical protein [Pantoea]MCH9299917.1 hypothetical protein [Pantoea allii]PQK87849.1 hypothetical protein CG433_22035 [Pantoea ananatis]